MRRARATGCIYLYTCVACLGGIKLRERALEFHLSCGCCCCPSHVKRHQRFKAPEAQQMVPGTNVRYTRGVRRGFERKLATSRTVYIHIYYMRLARTSASEQPANGHKKIYIKYIRPLLFSACGNVASISFGTAINSLARCVSRNRLSSRSIVCVVGPHVCVYAPCLLYIYAHILTPFIRRGTT